MPWDDGLEDPSLSIAATDDSPLRVRAGPGTGKTFTLIRRITRLLESGVEPKGILVCTFTRTAADDLKRELNALKVAGASSVHATTVHALCFGILSRNDVFEITGRMARPLLEYETRFLLEDLQNGSFGNIHKRRKRLKAFESAWARLQTDQPGWPSDALDRKFQQRLYDWLKFHKAMLIGELVPEAFRYLRNNPASPDRRAFSHLLVDEYQDLNTVEQEFIQLIAENARLTIIGDENQSIYSFKYAHPQGISEFHARHAGTTDATLDICRRCPTGIVDMANHLISCSPKRSKHVLIPRPENGKGEIYIVQWKSIKQETQGISRFIKRRIEGGVNPGRVLVLAPLRQLGYEVRDALNERGVQAHSFFQEEALDGDPKKIDECRIQLAFTLLTLLANPEDNVALRCWCGFGSSDLRRGAWDRVRNLCVEKGIILSVALENIRRKQLGISYSSHIIQRLEELHMRLQHLAPLRGSQLVDALFPSGDPDFSQIRNIAIEIEEGADASQILEHLRKGITQPELPTDVDYVRVMSLHKSKGLTADLVVVMGCIEGLMPTLRGSNPVTHEDIDATVEEQRRLFYVAITRARKILVLSSVTSLPWNLAHKMGVEIRNRENMAGTITTRFIEELGPTRPKPVAGQ